VLPGRWPDPSAFGGLVQEYHELREEISRIVQGDHSKCTSEASATLCARLLCDIRFDLCVVVLMRRVVAGFLDREPADDIESTIFEVAKAQYGSLQAFASAEVLPLGQEAEGATIAIAARELRVRMRIMQLDSLPGELSSYVYPSEDYQSPLGIRVCLLFRPGHYEVLYLDRAPRLPEPPTVKSRCSFCRDVTSLPTAALLTCFHRLCQNCTSHSRRKGDNLQCPICSDVPLPDYVRAQLQNKDEGPARHTWSGPMPHPARTAAPGSPARQSDGRGSVGTPSTPQTGPLWPGPRQLPAQTTRGSMPQTRGNLPQTRRDLSRHSEPQPEPQNYRPPGTGYYDRPPASCQTLQKEQHVPQSEDNNRHRRNTPSFGDAYDPSGYGPSTSLNQRHVSAPGGGGGDRQLRTPGTASFPEPPAGMRLPQTGVLSSRANSSPHPNGGTVSAEPLPRWGNGSGDHLASPPRTAMQLAQSPGNSSLSRGGNGYPSTGRLTPQSEVSLQGHRSPGAQGAPHCFHCKDTQHLRRVKCCDKHYCLHCLKDMTTEAQRNNVLRCSYCGAPWDLVALSKACGVHPSRTGGTPARQVAPPPSFGRGLY
jgi:hypothetical protein